MKQIFSFHPLLILLSFILFLPSFNFAQGVTSSAIEGTVREEGWSPLPAATVLAVHVPSGSQYGTTSRADGRYNLLGLRVGGPYKVTVSFVGYTTQLVEDLYLDLNQTLSLDFVLRESALVLEVIEVTAEQSSVFNSGRTGAAQSVTRDQIDKVPTISRSFQDFAKLSPLFSGTTASAAGRSNRYNNIQLDGTQYNDLFGLGATGTPGGQAGTNPISLDAIEEFQVVIAPYDVRLGGFTGGGINAITKSGTNKFDLSGYYYGRNQNLVGKSPDDKRLSLDEFDEAQYGFRLGGPIIKDQLFFFVSGELTENNSPSQNVALQQGPSGATAAAERMSNILINKYGYNPGSFGATTIKQPSMKIFARLDYNLSQNHKLTLRHNYVDAERDILGSRNTNNRLSFDSYKYLFTNSTHSTVAILNSTFGNTMANELIAGYTRIRDTRGRKDNFLPEVEVREPGLTLTAGTERFSTANRLDQDILEFTNNFTYFLGDHVLTAGTHNEYFTFTNLFVRAFYGYYVFNSLDDLENGNVNFYQRNYSRTADPNQAAEFSVLRTGFYVQDEWTAHRNLKLTLGLRLDIPFFPTAPERNDSVSQYFPGYATDQIPSGNMTFSPRLGFNWDVFGNRTTQIRGGTGVFSGRVPYVWISNNFGNTGTLYAEVRGGAGTIFSPDPFNQPKSGDPGTGAPRLTSEVNIIDPDYVMPSLFRGNIAIDQKLKHDFVLTGEFLYSKSINDPMYEKINIRPATTTWPDGRPRYGGTEGGNGNFFDVLLLKNTGDHYQYNFSFQLQRNVARGISTNIGYTFTKAMDKNSVTSSQARSQMRFNAVPGDPNNPPLTRSVYDIPHRIFASISYTTELFAKNAATTISIFYNGQSGRPYSYIYRGDFNNDGFDANDLIYVPRNADDIILTTGNWAELNAFIESDDYLRNQRGSITKRNAARNPWMDMIDLRIVQEVPIIAGHKLEFSLDILNVMNLIYSQWGRVEFVPFDYELLGYQGVDAVSGKPQFSFAPPANNNPFTVDNLASRWQLQFGVRYAF